MKSGKQEKDSYPELCPDDYDQRLERLLELVGLSWEEFADLLGVELDLVIEWRDGAIPPADKCGASCVWRGRFPAVLR